MFLNICFSALYFHAQHSSKKTADAVWGISTSIHFSEILGKKRKERHNVNVLRHEGFTINWITQLAATCDFLQDNGRVINTPVYICVSAVYMFTDTVKALSTFEQTQWGNGHAHTPNLQPLTQGDLSKYFPPVGHNKIHKGHKGKAQ